MEKGRKAIIDSRLAAAGYVSKGGKSALAFYQLPSRLENTSGDDKPLPVRSGAATMSATPTRPTPMTAARSAARSATATRSTTRTERKWQATSQRGNNKQADKHQGNNPFFHDNTSSWIIRKAARRSS